MPSLMTADDKNEGTKYNDKMVVILATLINFKTRLFWSDVTKIVSLLLQQKKKILKDFKNVDAFKGK